MYRKWTQEEVKYLKLNFKTADLKTIEKYLGRTATAIHAKAERVGLFKRKWTDEEVEYLQDKWGTISIKTIAKNLGRTVAAIKMKSQKIGLSDARFCFEGITLKQLAEATNISYSTYQNWVKSYDFPIKKKVFAQTYKVKVVYYNDFWEWAEKNKQMINFSRFEKGILGPEPAWVDEKRTADFIKLRKIKKSFNNAWTKEEDNILKGMLNAYQYTYPEISQRLNRSEGAIKRRILDLGLKARPIRLNNHIKYTPEEVELIVTLFDKGHCLEDIASRINKSALGVRGKLERMGYKFSNGVPIRKDGKI